LNKIAPPRQLKRSRASLFQKQQTNAGLVATVRRAALW
jgi:hypothetical protein